MGSRAARDLGMARIGTLTRYMAVGAVVAGGVLSAAVAKALPGHTASSRASTAGGTTAPPQVPATTPAGPTDPSAGGSSGSSDPGAGLAAPVQAPQPVQTAPVVNSGGS